MRRLFSLFVLSIAMGCGSEKPAASQWMPIAEVAELVKVAQEKLPNVKFESARKIKVKGEDVYEIRGKQPNGKVREVEVSDAGQVLEVE